MTLSLCAALAAGAATRPADVLSGSRVDSIAVSGNLIPVTSCADDGSDGTLRKAIEGAADGDTIDMSGLACSLITLQSGSLVSAVPNLTLLGPGVDALSIDGNASDRVLTGTSLSLTDLSIANGLTYSEQGGGCIKADGNLTLTRVKVDSCSIVSATSAPGGGALVLGDLTMQDSAITGSVAAAAQTAGGGGAFVLGTTTLSDSTVSANMVQAGSGGGYGGGLLCFGDVTLRHSAISTNRAQSSGGAAFGGGIQARGNIAVAIVDESSIDGNSTYTINGGSYGGGINDGITSTTYASTVTITRSTVTGNTASSVCSTCVVTGGGVHVFDSIITDDAAFTYNSATCDPATSCVAAGGSISSMGAASGSEIKVINSTISGGDVIGGGGGAGVGGGIAVGQHKYLSATNSTIAFNHASHDGGGIALSSQANAPSKLDSTIVANNQTDAGQNDVAAPNEPAVITGSHNLAMTWMADVTMPVDTITLDPGLLPLSTSEGGPTAVHPLSPNSLAVNNGSNPESLGCDQRGFPYRRIYGSSADIGAYEFQGEPHLFADNFDGSSSCPPTP